MAGTRSVAFLIAGLTAVFAVQFLMLIWALKWWRLHLQAQGPSRAGEHPAEEGGGLSAEQLGELPCHECKDGAAGGGGECAVCLEAFRAGDRCRALPGCGHGFHAECADSWLRKSARCPICPADVVVVARGKNAGAVAAEAAALEIVAER